MVNDEIMNRLREISDLEKEILSELEKNSVNVKKPDKAKKDKAEVYLDINSYRTNILSLMEEGKLIYARPNPRFVHIPEHYKEYVEVVYVCSGSILHIANGTSIYLREGELLFLGKGVLHEIYPASEDDIAVSFTILPRFFDKALEMLGENETPLRKFLVDSLENSSGNSAFLYYRVSDVVPIQNIIENLLWTFIKETTYRNNINQTTMGLLLLHLMNYSDYVETDSSDETAIIQVLKYIEKNYKEASLTEIAQLLHYDMFFLSKEIKKRTGKNFKELLQEKRLMQSAYLLIHTSQSVDNIAENVGYSNISYFHRIFQKRFDMTPRTYRISNSKSLKK